MKVINIITGRPAKVEQYGDELIVRCEDIERAKIIEQKVDMVILAVGTEPNADSANIAKMLGITVDANGWFNESNYIGDPVIHLPVVSLLQVFARDQKIFLIQLHRLQLLLHRVLQSIAKNKIKNSIKDLSLEQIETKAKELSKILEGQI